MSSTHRIERLENLITSLSDEDLEELLRHKTRQAVALANRLHQLTKNNLYILLCEQVREQTGRDIFDFSAYFDSLPAKHLKLAMKYTLTKGEAFLVFAERCTRVEAQKGTIALAKNLCNSEI